MKRYTALLLTIVSLAGLTWAGMLTIRTALAPAPYLSVPRPASMRTKDGDEALQRMRVLDQVLGQIDRMKPLPTLAATGPIAQPAVLPLNATANSTTQIAQQKSAKPAPLAEIEASAISLVYLSTDMQRAVINGNLYANGDLLPDGGRLLDIGMNQVVIEVGGRRKVLQVPRTPLMGSTVRPVKVQ